MKEIRWHGRGGQGAKTVSELLAAAMLRADFYVQAFPEYGPERSGAPLQAYTRFSARPIRIHSGVTDPDTVVVLDDSLLEEVDVVRGLKQGGLLLINSRKTPEEIGAQLGFGGRIVCVDAPALAAKAGGKYGNVVMVGALAAFEEKLDVADLRPALSDVFGEKLSEAVLEVNFRSVEMGYQEVSHVAGSGQADGSAGPAGTVGQVGPYSAEKISFPELPGKGELMSYEELPMGGVLPAEFAAHPRTGSWRTDAKPRVNIDKCVNCLLCWVNCPDAAVVLHDTRFFGFDYDYCKGCGLCEESCPTKAIDMIPEHEEVPEYGRVQEVAT